MWKSQELNVHLKHIKHNIAKKFFCVSGAVCVHRAVGVGLAQWYFFRKYAIILINAASLITEVSPLHLEKLW